MHGIAVGMLMAAVAIGLTGRANCQGRGPQRSEVSGVVKSVDAGAGTITITISAGERRDGREGRERQAPVTTDRTYSLAKDVEVASGSGFGRGGGGLFKEVRLADLAAGVRVSLTLSADEKSVDSILAEGPTVRGQIKAVDGAKNSLTILLPSQQRGREEPAAAEEKTYTLTPDAEIAVDTGRGGRFSIKEARLTDLAQGAVVSARLSVNLKQVQSLLAEGPGYSGAIKALDPNKRTLTLVVRPPRGDDAGEEQSLAVAADAVVLLDDGKGRRLSIKEGKLADVPSGATATVKLSVDQSQVMMLRVEGPILTGQLKAVDADRHLIIIAIPRGRGEEPEEKTFTVARDARIAIDGSDVKLANLKVGDTPPLVQLRLSLDQKTVQSVTARQSQSR
jgi:hypothetical protein